MSHPQLAFDLDGYGQSAARWADHAAELPDSGRNLARLLGTPLAQRLCAALGGTTLPVPKGHPRLAQARLAVIEAAIGADGAAILMREYGGEQLYIPRGVVALRAERNRAIRADFARLTGSGSSVNAALIELAVLYRICDRQIREIVSG
jgi:hypothetical protein